MPATVIHCRYAAAYPADQYVYCGRPSLWGNPFGVRGTDWIFLVKTREEAIRRYREWFYAPAQADFRDFCVAHLPDKVLGCWCAPRPCHVQIIADYVNQHATPHQAPRL